MCARVSGMQTLIVPQLPRASFLLARSGSSTVESYQGSDASLFTGPSRQDDWTCPFLLFCAHRTKFPDNNRYVVDFIGRAVPAVFHVTRRFFPECREVLHCLFVKRGCLALT